MPLTKIKDRFQITIPSPIRRQLNLKVGDILETVLEDQRIVLKIKALVDRPRTTEGRAADSTPEEQAPGHLPATPSLEERGRLIQLLQGSAEDDELDFPLDVIQASRTSKKAPVPFD